jgi:hypothetical protein
MHSFRRGNTRKDGLQELFIITILEHFNILRYDTVYIGVCVLTLWKRLLSPSSGPSKKFAVLGLHWTLFLFVLHVNAFGQISHFSRKALEFSYHSILTLNYF